MRGGNRFGVEEHDLVGRGVVQAGDEKGVGGYRDSVGRQAGADLGIVKGFGGDARVDVAGVTAAGTAVEGGAVGVVGALTAVAAKEHEAGEVFNETHVAQGPFGECCARLGRSGGEVGGDP